MFPPIPTTATADQIEPGGGVPAHINAEMAFTAAFYAPGYGEASARAVFEPGMTIMEARQEWNSQVTGEYHRASSVTALRRLFFRNGLWQVFLDPDVPEEAAYRERFEAGDLTALRKDRNLNDLILATRKEHFERTSGLPHATSHTDAMRLTNTVLHVGERRWRVTDRAEKAAMIIGSLPEMRRLALWHTREVNHAAYFMVNRRDPSRYSERYLKTKREDGKVSFDRPAIEAEVLRREPDSPLYARRGCPVLGLKTVYRGLLVLIFGVMNDTIVRMYLETGAIDDPSLRALPRPLPT